MPTTRTVPPDLADIRARTLAGLRDALSAEDVAGAENCAQRLYAALPVRERPGDNVVLVAYGGGKDSTYTLAFVRMVQLLLHDRYGSTFRLRSATNRQAGMPQAVMDNIDRAYQALGFAEDPDCTAIMIEDDEVRPFGRDEPASPRVLARNRLDMLMTGHRTMAEGRPTFCNSCNLSMVNSFGIATAYDGGVDLVITGDSPAEQRSYYLWVNRLARNHGRQPRQPGDAGFGSFLRSADAIAGVYFTEIFGADAKDEVAARGVASDVPKELRFFSIFEDTGYSSLHHWPLLTGFLGFAFDELAFSFTESDCANPTLMAHLRGLKCERLYGRDYGEGLDEYVAFATRLMHTKEFPDWLVDRVRQRYDGPDAAVRMRERANGFAAEAYGLGEEQLICMVYSPFAGKGERLGDYLTRERPHLLDRLDEIHDFLAGGPDSDVAAELSAASGLEPRQLRTLYGGATLLGVSEGRGNILQAMLDGDPHKEVIMTRRSPDGPLEPELLSGR
ncbi:hypothetical protein ACLQ29_24140 [Micromonospora sp. DT228]|uniref:hypothetical protein n=1 Tax=Micromonospora sp. DT228 TaxID=3393443 RepID=UPI003CF924FC